MKYSFNDTMEQAKRDYGLGSGESFKVQEGDNVIRILSPCLPHQSTYTDKAGKTTTTFKFVAWILDRKDNLIKLYFMPMKIMNAIGDLQASRYYGFDEVPMPYDIVIKAKNAGKLEVEYSVLPVPEKVLLTGAEMQAFEEKPTIDEVIEKLKEKQGTESQLESPHNASVASGYEKARSGANSLPGGNRGSQGSPEHEEEVSIDDIPY